MNHVKWHYDQYSTYSATCPNTGSTLEIERVRIRQIANRWVMMIDGIEPCQAPKHLGSAQRKFEAWIQAGSQPEWDGWV